MIRKTAYWCDVCPLPGGGFAFVYVTGIGNPNTWNTVVCTINGQIIWQTTTTSTPRYLRCASDNNGNITAVGQGQNGEGLLVIRASGCYIWLNKCFSGPAIRWNGTAFDIFVQTNNSYYVKITETPHGLSITSPINIPIWPGGNGTTPNGWSQVTSPDGLNEQLRWADEYRFRTIRGTNLIVTMEYNEIVTGQTQLGIIGGIGLNAGQPFIALNAPGMDPRLAYSSVLNKWACCSWTTGNLVYYNEFPQFIPLDFCSH